MATATSATRRQEERQVGAGREEADIARAVGHLGVVVVLRAGLLQPPEMNSRNVPMISVSPAVRDSADDADRLGGRQERVDDRGDREERGQAEEDPGLDAQPAAGGIGLLVLVLVVGVRAISSLPRRRLGRRLGLRSVSNG